jgi:hypothetical protein
MKTPAHPANAFQALARAFAAGIGKELEAADAHLSFSVSKGGVLQVAAHVSLKRGGLQVSFGDRVSGRHASVELEEEELLGIINGEVPAQHLYATGKIKISGALEDAIWAGKIFTVLRDVTKRSGGE